MGTLTDSRVNTLYTKVIDQKGRQTKNAADATDQQDYVTLSQVNGMLNGLGKSSGNSSAAPSPQTASSSYILEVLGNLAIGTNLAGKRVVTSSGVPSLVRVDLDSAATGHTIDIQIYQNTTLWLSFSIPVSVVTFSVPASKVTAAGSLTSGNYLRLDITARGSTNPGKNLYCTIVQ